MALNLYNLCLWSSKSFLKHLNELGNYEANTSANGTTQVHNIPKPVNNFSLGTETCVDARPSARRKASRLGKPVIKEENLGKVISGHLGYIYWNIIDISLSQIEFSSMPLFL